MTSCPEVWAEDFEIWKKSVSWVLASEEEGWLSGLAETRPGVCGWGPHVLVVVVVRADGKISIDCVSLSSCRKTLKLKGNKKFCTWTNFVNFVFLDFLCLFHISVSWVCNPCKLLPKSTGVAGVSAAWDRFWVCLPPNHNNYSNVPLGAQTTSHSSRWDSDQKQNRHSPLECCNFIFCGYIKYEWYLYQG